MMQERLESMGITLDTPPEPAGSYAGTVRSGNLLFVSGQIPILDGKVVHTGKVSDQNIEAAQESARLCAINIMARIKKDLGDLDKVTRIVKVSGFVNAVPGFTRHPQVINAASDLLYDVFGAKHARIAMGAGSLPFDSMTEIDAIVEFAA